MKDKLFRRDFTMVVIGQIISLFGNNILRYALPLYLLNKTGSAALYGMVVALSFLPMVILSPVGGIIADRVNKRNIMVCLDFCTAGSGFPSGKSARSGEFATRPAGSGSHSTQCSLDFPSLDGR